MSYKIIVDSACELTEEMKKDSRIAVVPFTLLLDGVETIDDETFNQAEFIARTKASKNGPKSQCPGPGAFVEHMESGEDHIFIITISSQLSGSYNSATAAKQMILEDNENVQVHIVDSKSTSLSETLIIRKIQEYEALEMSFDDIVDKIEKYRDDQNTYFVLETLETLRKNGRLSNLKATVASVLNIKPVMGATPEGTIMQLSQARGINGALKKMVEVIVKDYATKDVSDIVVGICQCNCPDRANMIKNDLLAMLPFKDVVILPAAGISTMYANEGGIIVVI